MGRPGDFACLPLPGAEAVVGYDVRAEAVVATLRERVSLIGAALLSRRVCGADMLGPLEAILASEDVTEPSLALAALDAPRGRRHHHRHLCRAAREIEAAGSLFARTAKPSPEETMQVLSALRSGWRHLVHATAESSNALVDLRHCCGSHHNRVRKEDGNDGRLFHLEPGIRDEPEAPGQRGLLRPA